MAKGKMSFEDKRKKMLEIFKEHPFFFHKKDIEKLGVKKGIIYQAINDVLESLVNDNLVECDKIGSSNFYWSLPSKIYQIKKNTIEKNKQQIDTFNQENLLLQEKINEAKQMRKENKERKAKLEELEELLSKKEEYNKKLLEFKKNDPNRYQDILSDNKQLVALNELWKDNIYTLQQWLRSKCPDANIVDMFPELEQLNLFDN